ncbi:hypothetical protein ABIB38_000509 [Massilia sp. UYP11]|uniref:hypothetical protein n=1 Tax=Massilia sp. UYP11 TaxID=1756385 RepID=UPI003D1B4A11
MQADRLLRDVQVLGRRRDGGKAVQGVERAQVGDVELVDHGVGSVAANITGYRARCKLPLLNFVKKTWMNDNF